MNFTYPPVSPMVSLLNPTGVSFLLLLLPFALSGLIMWVWNLTVPEVFGLRRLKYWQAFRLWILVALFIGVGRIL